MFNRENAIGIVLLVLCGAVAVALLYSTATGTRFRLDGPAWLGPALAILFTGAAIWGFFTRPGRRWPWNRD
jgi:fatty acid desaturase